MDIPLDIKEEPLSPFQVADDLSVKEEHPKEFTFVEVKQENQMEAYKIGGRTFTPQFSQTSSKTVNLLKPQFQSLRNAHDSSVNYFRDDTVIFELEEYLDCPMSSSVKHNVSPLHSIHTKEGAAKINVIHSQDRTLEKGDEIIWNIKVVNPQVAYPPIRKTPRKRCLVEKIVQKNTGIKLQKEEIKIHLMEEETKMKIRQMQEEHKMKLKHRQEECNVKMKFLKYEQEVKKYHLKKEQNKRSGVTNSEN